jgi:hypothetical protein
MANGDKPPGGVSVQITIHDDSKSISISCKTHEKAKKAFEQIVNFVEEVKEKYEE